MFIEVKDKTKYLEEYYDTYWYVELGCTNLLFLYLNSYNVG